VRLKNRSSLIVSFRGMNLQDELVVCIRRSADDWSKFDEQQTIASLPKRMVFSMIPEEAMGFTFDSRIYVGIRKPSQEAARWASYTAIMELFIRSKHNWLLIIEEGTEIGDLSLIPKDPKPGLTRLGPGVQLLDKIAAKVIVRNLRLYYDTLDKMVDDLKTLRLLEIQEQPVFKKQGSSFIDRYGPLIISILLVLVTGLLFCPPYLFARAKELIRTTEVAAAEEAVVSGEGTGMSRLKDMVTLANQAGLLLGDPPP